MSDDLHTIHEADQRRERARALGGDVAAYYASLIAGGVPDETAAVLTSEMADMWIGSTLVDATVAVRLDFGEGE
jgi:hypothetical protein